jgi:hypothetical protein
MSNAPPGSVQRRAEKIKAANKHPTQKQIIVEAAEKRRGKAKVIQLPVYASAELHWHSSFSESLALAAL